MKKRSIFRQPLANADSIVASRSALLKGNLALTRRSSSMGDSIVSWALQEATLPDTIEKKAPSAGKNSSRTSSLSRSISLRREKNSVQRAIPPMRGSCTMKIGAREKLEIVRTSSVSFCGERYAGVVRLQIRRYADAEPPHTAQLWAQPRLLSSIVIG